MVRKKRRYFYTRICRRINRSEGGSTGQDTTGLPKYYSMFGGATTGTGTTSGALYVAPTPDVQL